jgi:hypothetical protein
MNLQLWISLSISVKMGFVQYFFEGIYKFFVASSILVFFTSL